MRLAAKPAEEMIIPAEAFAVSKALPNTTTDIFTFAPMEIPDVLMERYRPKLGSAVVGVALRMKPFVVGSVSDPP